MSRASRTKGRRYEQDIASWFRDEGFDAQTVRSIRGGFQGAQDILVQDLPRAYVECKAVEAGRPHQWMAKAVAEMEAGQVPMIFWKRDGRSHDVGEVVIMRRDDLVELLREAMEVLSE